MKTCATIAELERALMQPRREGAAIGFVPTMGALHDGHLSLVRRARQDNDVVVCSIFVNPTQFGPSEDLGRYPRMLQRDAARLSGERVDLLFTPEAQEVYPPGFTTRVDVGPLGEVLEGADRPGHFAGVATVVVKLLNMVRPARAYFGQKDAQQLAVVRRAVGDLNLGAEIVGCPTVREPDGLALSSRNAYLSPAERAAAPVLYRALTAARQSYAAGDRSAAHLARVMGEIVSREPLAELAYAAAVEPATMATLERVEDGALLTIAVRIGGTRLIDNCLLP